ncbi:hypothetical protein BC826DRAFT_67746 [Russula brevipes]|nr:hypothetical protein BC826DRAFT_67746 [Russula brevipes]
MADCQPRTEHTRRRAPTSGTLLIRSRRSDPDPVGAERGESRRVGGRGGPGWLAHLIARLELESLSSRRARGAKRRGRGKWTILSLCASYKKLPQDMKRSASVLWYLTRNMSTLKERIILTSRYMVSGFSLNDLDARVFALGETTKNTKGFWTRSAASAKLAPHGSMTRSFTQYVLLYWKSFEGSHGPSSLLPIDVAGLHVSQSVGDNRPNIDMN